MGSPVTLKLLFLQLVLLCSVSTSFTLSLTLSVPSHLPGLPASTAAYLTAHNVTLQTLVTRANTFVFPRLLPNTQSISSKSEKTSYLLDIACRDYDFAPYAVDVRTDEKDGEVAEIYRVARGGIDVGADRVRLSKSQTAVVELKVLKARDHYEARAGFNPLGLLKSPMILIGVVGLGFVVGMPYLLDNMDPDTRREFEEQQKKGIFGTVANPGGANNPLQNFDMASWMAGRQQSGPSPGPSTAGGTGSGSDAGSGSRARRRG